MKKLLSLALGGYLLLTLCNLPAMAPVSVAFIPTSTSQSTLPVQTATGTGTATATWTPSPIPTPTWVHFGPGVITVPIILYHHIGVSPGNSRFYISREKFEEQLKLLNDRGYRTITVRQLAAAITEGAELPERPIVITFDDGNIDNYTTAFPLMQEYGYSGTVYVVGSYVGADGYMSAEEIKEMVSSGWEIGSHGMTHADLTLLDADMVHYEISASKKLLEKTLGMAVESFAYPFGNSTVSINDYAYAAGYKTAMSLGNSVSHGAGNLFVLQRLDIKAEYDMDDFAHLLPW